MDAPRVNAAPIFLESFKEEQIKFLKTQLMFKSGFIYYGIIAGSLLTSMFYILPAARFIAKDEVRAKSFVDDVDNFRRDCITFAKKKGSDNINEQTIFPLNEDYLGLDDKFDALVRRFYNIMFETGFSP